MQTIKAFLQSPLFGFLLRVFTSIAAASFGILGVGSATRDHKGHLTRNGWVALIGIIVTGLLALVTSAYEFTTGELKEQAEREKSRKLFLTVQRGLYPFRQVRGSMTVRFTGTFDDLTEYRDLLVAVMPKEKFNNKSISAASQPDRAANTAGSGRGPWYLALSKALSVGLSNAYFRSLGLPSLFEDC